MSFSVKTVQAIENYRLLLSFENGEKRVFDMSPYLETGIFRELKDESLFESVRISFDTIEWANEADFDPEVLYEQGVLLA